MIYSVLEFFCTTYTGALLMICIGAGLILLAIRNPWMKKDWFRGDIRGWAGGIGLIFVGLVVILAKLLGKL